MSKDIGDFHSYCAVVTMSSSKASNENMHEAYTMDDG